MEPAWAIGLMTGTVLDGNIDIAMIRTDGEKLDAFGPYKLAPYPPELPILLGRALEEAAKWRFQGQEPAIFREAEAALTQAQALAVCDFLRENGLSPGDIKAIGFHGQTVLHIAPKVGRRGHTRQLGDGALMAKIVGADVVYDFRTADVEAGGQGAPLVPIYHRALLGRIGGGGETAMLNLGGVGNISWFDGDQMVAFDTGPANAPINDWVKRHGRGNFDADGRIALSGTVDEARLSRLLDHPYLNAPYPKSLDRNSFTADMAEGLNLEDGAATLTAFSAAAVGRALNLLPKRPNRLLVCGGGRKNPALMAQLRRRANVQAMDVDQFGMRGDAIEAECFAFLAVRSIRGLPISFPQTTGVSKPMSGGRLAPASARNAA